MHFNRKTMKNIHNIIFSGKYQRICFNINEYDAFNGNMENLVINLNYKEKINKVKYNNLICIGIFIIGCFIGNQFITCYK